MRAELGGGGGGVAGEGDARLLLVCAGNVCRSPIALHLLRARLDRLPASMRLTRSITLDDAGTRASDGVPMHPDSSRAIRWAGIEPHPHLSRRLSALQVQQADVVLALDRSVRREVVSMVPTASSRTYTVVEFRRLIDDVARITPGSPAHWRDLLPLVAERRGYPPPPLSPDELDIPDPMGRRAEAHVEVAHTLSDELDAILACASQILGESPR